MSFTPIENNQAAYKAMREYFSRPGAVLSKREPDSTSYPSCLYRLGQRANGPGCAIGCLIPDELYIPNFESVGTVEELVEQHPEIADIFENCDIDFLMEAQDLHDNQADSVEHFILLLDELAGSEDGAFYNLEAAEASA